MARPATNPTARLRRIETARAKFIAGLAADIMLTSRPMAQALGVNWTSLREWCDSVPGFEESGAFTRGGNGIEYEFRPLATMDFLVAHFRGEVERRQAANRKEQRMVAGDAADDLPADFNLDQLNKLLAITARFQEVKERQGEQTPTAKVVAAARGCFSAMSEAGAMAAQEEDPTGQWTPETRSIVESVIRRMLLKQQNAAREFVRQVAGSDPQPGAAG